MLLEFTLSNHRSFGSEQTISLIASRLKDKQPGRTIAISAPQKVEVLTSAIILGKNGSGKSGLVSALSFVRNFVRTSSNETQLGEDIQYSPFKFNDELANSDTTFRIVFYKDAVVYEYAFSLNSKRISSETLFRSDKTVRFRKVFERHYEPENNSYSISFAEDVRGEKATWRESTRENALLLSTAVQLNAEAFRGPYEWLANELRTISASPSTFQGFTAKECQDPLKKDKILKFLQHLDIQVDDIAVEEEEIDVAAMREFFNEDIVKAVFSDDKDRKSRKVKFMHKGDNGEMVPLEIREESTGTRALFGLTGPLFDTLQNGYCLVIDEINTNIHPLVLRTLIDLFSDPKINKNSAQILFTSHDTSLLADSYFRRDQIWFVEFNKSRRSELVPLSDYSPRRGEALEKGYLGGRYGGIPAIDLSHRLLTRSRTEDA